jgi:hypothetical protein
MVKQEKKSVVTFKQIQVLTAPIFKVNNGIHYTKKVVKNSTI